MKLRTRGVKAFPLLCIVISICSASAFSAELSLDAYLSQVRSRNGAVLAAEKSAEGAKQRSVEGELVFAPQLFGNASYTSDASASTGLPRDKVIYDNYTLGISKQFDIGLAAKIYYTTSYTDLFGLNPQLAAAYNIPPSFYDAKPAIEITQSLWRNFGGAETRASEEVATSGALATSYNSNYSIKLLLADAEGTYWRLALARDTVALARDNLGRASKLREWSQRRVNLQLADKSDLLQAESAFQVRQLELQAALDEESAAARAFNSARGVDSNSVTDSLPTLTRNILGSISTPVRAAFREDVLAAQQQARAAIANTQLGNERNSPDVQAFAQFALNGHDPTLGTAMSNSLTTNNPTTAVGVKFTTPLDFGVLKADRYGYAKERQGAEDALSRKYFEQEREWQDLSAKLQETKQRLEMALKLEDAQKQKLTVEKERLSRGRTTTFQVLLFEQDYSQAQLARIQTEAQMLRLIAQMRTFAAAGKGGSA